MASIPDLQRAIINADKAGDTEGAAKLTDALKRQMAVTPRPQAEIDKEYAAQPWYSKLGTAADDLVRIGADGISFGGLDKLLGPEQQKLTEEARMRAGTASIPTELLGNLFSPITGAVGAGGKLALKAAPGLLARLGIGTAEAAPGIVTRAAVGATEGGTMGAADAKIRGNDVLSGAETGAALGGALPLAAKALSRTASFLQGTKPGAIEEAYTAGKEGGNVSKSFRQGQSGAKMKDAQQEFAAGEAGWNKTAPVPWNDLASEMRAIRNEVYTSSGVSKLEGPDEEAFRRMNGIIRNSLGRGSNVENMDAIRRQIDRFADGTPMQKMMATRLKGVIRSSVQGVEENYTPVLQQYEKSKVAHAAGTDLNTVFPKGSLLGHLAQGAVFGSGVIGAPIVGPGVAAALPAFSPKVSGLLANLIGEVAGRTGANLGMVEPAWTNYQEQRKRDKKKRKSYEITIPGGGLPVGQSPSQ